MKEVRLNPMLHSVNFGFCSRNSLICSETTKFLPETNAPTVGLKNTIPVAGHTLISFAKSLYTRSKEVIPMTILGWIELIRALRVIELVCRGSDSCIYLKGRTYFLYC